MLKQSIGLCAMTLAPFMTLMAETLDPDLKNTRLSAQIQTVTSDYNQNISSSNTSVDLLMPLFGDNKQITFLDAQMSIADQLYQTYSMGFGHRMSERNIVYGIYGFYDYQKSLTANTYHRFTMGAELLAQDWSLRSNFYLYPNTQQHRIAEIKLTDLITAQVYEQAVSGVEIELGHTLWLDNLTGYLSYYQYGNMIKGLKARFEYQVNPHVALTLSAQRDPARGTIASAGVMIFIGQDVSKTNSLLDRLYAPVSRDMTVFTATGVDISTNTQDSTQTSPPICLRLIEGPQNLSKRFSFSDPNNSDPSLDGPNYIPSSQTANGELQQATSGPGFICVYGYPE